MPTLAQHAGRQFQKIGYCRRGEHEYIVHIVSEWNQPGVRHAKLCSGLLTFLGLEFHLIEQRIVQLQLAIGGQRMLWRHQHIWTTQGLWV